MPQSVLLQARGLYTFPNTLSEIPQGALTTADNTIIDRNGVIEPRRGNQQYGTTFGTTSDYASQLMTYKKTLLMQYNSTIQYDSDHAGTWAAFSGSFPPAQAGLRTKYIEANGNFYFTSSKGIECISALTDADFTTAANYIRQAGGIQALDVSGTLDYSGGGWFIYPTSTPGQSKVAYRVTWAFYDANKDFVEGVPSSRLVLTNYSTTDSATVNLTFQIPPQIMALAPDNTQFFYTIYRTAVVQTSVGVTLANLDPGDEQYQVIQAFPTPAQLLAGTVTVNDSTPETFRANGALLYTNPVSGQGILQSNYAPPFALDINLFQQTTFYANTQTIQQLNLALLSTQNLISGTSTVTIAGQTYTFVGTPEIQDFTFDTQANTTDGGYFLLNSSSNVRKYFVWFNKSGTPEIQTLTFDNVIMPPAGSYFLINSADNTNLYFVWFDPTGATATPSGVDTLGRTGIRVSSAGLTTGSQIANAVASVLPTIDFLAIPSSNTVTVTNMANGVTTAATNGGIPVTNFTVVVNQVGVDPTPAPSNADTVGRLGISVDITQAVSATDVANAANLAINTVNDFTSVYTSGSTIRVTNADNGVTTQATDSTFVPVGGTFTITLIQAGTGVTGSFYTFTTSSASAATGDTYSNNGQTFTVISTINSETTLLAYGTGAPTVSGNLVRITGTGTDPIPFSAFSFTPNEVILGNNVSPAISIDETARSLVAAINMNSSSTVNAFYTSGPTDLPGLILIQGQNLATPAFTATANSTATGNEFSPALPTSGSTIISTNLSQINAIYYSKFQQPEAVPLVNFFLVGPKDKAILRILPIRTGLMIFKEDGIYQLTGTNGQFVINPFDSSAILLAPDSAQVLNNQVYMFSTQGIVTVSDTGVSVISRPIENSLQQIITSAYDFIPNTFGVAYESDRAYLLWTVTNTNDTVPTQCFRYNTFTAAWTRWPITKNCGVVLLNQNILYLGPTDANFIEQERKNINRTDYADRQFQILVPAFSNEGDNQITLSSTNNVDVGDVLVQTQYLTIAQFNQLLKMLDSDIGVGYKNYNTLFSQDPGGNLRTALNDLANRLDTDPGLSESDFFSSMTGGTNFIDFQTDYNILTNLLNLNTNPLFSNYPTSAGTVVFDLIITNVIQNTNDVEVQYLLPYIEGPIIVTKGITTEIIWAPQTFGDPSISKHVSEGTFIFDNNLFTSATVSYASDLMTGFQDIPFPESGIGDWGGFVWGGQTWGGEGTSVPLRTYIPRNQQYCRFIRPRFVHKNSREKFSLFGTSLTFRPLTERAYRS